MRVDAHHHFWRIAERIGDWPPPTLAPLHRDFMPADLAPLLRHADIDATVLVQTLPNRDDTDALLAIAATTPFVRGVVGWVDMTRAEAAAQIADLAAHPLLKGLRPMLQDLPEDDGWADDAVFDAAARAMVAHGLSFDALVRPPQLPGLLRFATRHPRLAIVIDHAAKPFIASGRLEPWRADITALAALPQVYCKLSGLLTEAGAHPTAGALAPYVDHLFAQFGAARLMWGSDWPVLGLAADYGAWHAMARSLCATRTDAQGLAAIFGGNARGFYRLDG